MVLSSDETTDGFTQEFESLIDLPLCVAKVDMSSISLVPNRAGAPSSSGAQEHTADHTDCPACQAANRALVADNLELATMIFNEAGKSWMLLRRQSELKERTHESTQGNINALAKFFGALRLCDITPGHLRGYQIARRANLIHSGGRELRPWKGTAGNSAVNHEISVLGQMLTHCRLWHRIKPYYFPLSVQGWSPRQILTEEQEEKLWADAAKCPEASLAYWVATITNNTTASGIELRGLRLKHLFLDDEIAEIYIPEDSVKNNSRPRKIALNPTARWAVGRCFKRALKLGSYEPDHFLFPLCVKRNHFDPERRASRSWLRKSWGKLRKATGLSGLSPHDLRHHCITRMLENDVNENTVIAIAGHVTRKMMEYYAHHRRRVKYAAVLAIESRPKKKAADSESAPANNLKMG